MLPLQLARTTRVAALFLAATMQSSLLRDAFEVVEAIWCADVDNGDMSDQTCSRYLHLVSQFINYACACGANTLDEALSFYSPWISAWGKDRQGGSVPPGLSVKHLRSCAVRAFFRTARTLGLTESTPAYESREMGIAARSGRALNETEADRLRSVASTYQHTRIAAAVAVGLSGAGTADLANIQPDHVDLRDGTIWLPGGRQISSRTVAIPGQWEYDILAVRLQDLHDAGSENSGLIVNRTGSAQSRQAGAAVAVSEALGAAGLRRDSDIKPVSLQRWAATATFEKHQDIASVARLLGTTSLDTAAIAIGWDWTDGHPPALRTRPDYRPGVVA